METRPREGVMKEKFPNTRKPSHWQVCGEFWNLRGQHNWEEIKINVFIYKINFKNPQSMHLTTTPSREVAQMLVSATSEWELNREARAALLRVRTGPECPEDNLRELT